MKMWTWKGTVKCEISVLANVSEISDLANEGEIGDEVLMKLSGNFVSHVVEEYIVCLLLST